MMSIRKLQIDVDPETPATEIFRLVEEAADDVDLRLGKRVLHISRSEPEDDVDHPTVARDITRDEIEQEAHDAWLRLKNTDSLVLVTDEATGHQRYVARSDGSSNVRDRHAPRDMDAFFENVAELAKLVDFERLAESIERQRQFDIAAMKRDS